MRPSDSPEQAAAATPVHDRVALAQSALKDLFEVSPGAILVTDAQGVIRGANPCSPELFGHTQAALYRLRIAGSWAGGTRPGMGGNGSAIGYKEADTRPEQRDLCGCRRHTSAWSNLLKDERRVTCRDTMDAVSC